MKSKEKSEKAGAFAKGGSGKMAPKMGVQPAEAGVAAPTRAPKASNNAPKGGSARGSKQGGVVPSAAGVAMTYGSGNNTFKAEGGKGHMAGFTGSTTAKPL